MRACSVIFMVVIFSVQYCAPSTAAAGGVALAHARPYIEQAILRTIGTGAIGLMHRPSGSQIGVVLPKILESRHDEIMHMVSQSPILE